MDIVTFAAIAIFALIVIGLLFVFRHKITATINREGFSVSGENSTKPTNSRAGGNISSTSNTSTVEGDNAGQHVGGNSGTMNQTRQDIHNEAPNQGAQGTFEGPVTFNQQRTNQQLQYNAARDLIQAGRDVTHVSGDNRSGRKPEETGSSGEELQQRRFEAAMPEAARVDTPTEVRVVIALENSVGLRALLPDFTESGELIKREDIEDREVRLTFPASAQSTEVFVVLEAPDFTIAKANLKLQIPRDKDSGVATFALTPRQENEYGRVIVYLLQDESVVETLTLYVSIKSKTFRLRNVWRIFSSNIVINQGVLVEGDQYNTGRDTIQAGRDMTHIGGDKIGGDYVRGDQIDAQKSQGFINRPTGSVSQHFGDTVSGDKVSGDITATGISGTGVSIGHKGQVNVQQGGDQAAFAQAFARVYETINTRPPDPDVGKDEITETVKNIEQEAQKGEQANEKKLSRWLNTLAGMAEDIFEVTVAALTGPQAAFATVARKVAERAKGERK